MSNVEQLKEAGLLKANLTPPLSAAQRKALNDLTADEVKSLITVWTELSKAFAGRTAWVMGISAGGHKPPPHKPRPSHVK